MKETNCYKENSETARGDLQNLAREVAAPKATVPTTNLLQFLYLLYIKNNF